MRRVNDVHGRALWLFGADLGDLPAPQRPD